MLYEPRQHMQMKPSAQKFFFHLPLFLTMVVNKCALTVILRQTDIMYPDYLLINQPEYGRNHQ